ncbi:MAG TPA: HNH endonuclease signature motif containing protein [Gaiellaceae bacterium]
MSGFTALRDALCSIEGECWIWKGPYTGAYPRLTLSGGDPAYVHRLVYEAAKGSIPEWHDIHHACENKGCVNPAHLVALTRQIHASQHPGTQTYCRRGHPFTAENSYLSGGRRWCRQCKRERDRKYRAAA